MFMGLSLLCFLSLNVAISSSVRIRSSGRCFCGRENVNTRIVGGVEAQPNRYPFVAAFTEAQRKAPFCGGVVINDRYLLTAAHCFIDFKAKEVNAILGMHDVKNITSSNIFPVDAIIPHPNYKGEPYHKDDIALVRLTKALTFGSTVGTVCLIPDDVGQMFANLFVAGWGLTADGGEVATKLMEVSVPQIPNKNCTHIYGRDYFTSKQLCAVKDGMDACTGDSGGPLMTRYKGKVHVVGVVSWGIRCGSVSYPGVYTRVSSYLDWIKKSTRDATYCST